MSATLVHARRYFTDVIKKLGPSKSRKKTGLADKALLQETLLAARQIAESNALLINGVPLETLLPQALASASCYASCGALTGRSSAGPSSTWGAITKPSRKSSSGRRYARWRGVADYDRRLYYLPGYQASVPD